MSHLWLLGWIATSGCGGANRPTGPQETGTTTDTGPTTEIGTATGEVEPFVDGERLKAVYLEANGEAPILQHWWDTELEAACRPTMDATFALRCLPDSAATLVYLDEDCTEPAYEAPSCDDPVPSHVRVSLPERCIGPSRAAGYAVGDAVVASRAYSLLGDGRCLRVDRGEDVTFRRLAPVDDATFVAFTGRHVPLDGGLGVRVLDGDDGASQVYDLVATGPDQVCHPVELGPDHDLFCLHGDFAYDFGNLYADATCEAGAIAYSIGAEACDPPSHALVARLDGTCGLGTTLHAIGAEVTTAHQGSPAECVPARFGSTYYAVGDAVDNTLPPLPTAPSGDGRLRVMAYATPGGRPLVSSGDGWFDEALGASCSARDTETHETVCLPDHFLEFAGRGSFADAACTEPLLPWSDDPCAGPVPDLFATLPPAECGLAPIDQVRSVGARHDGPVYWSEGVSCIQRRDPGVAYYALGQTMDLGVYAAVRIVGAP